MSVYCKNQLFNVFYDVDDEILLPPLLHQAAHRMEDLVVHSVKVFAAGPSGGLTITKFYREWFYDVNGRIVENFCVDENDSMKWTKVKVSVKYGSEYFTINFYAKKCQVQGRTETYNPKSVEHVLRTYTTHASVAVRLSKPHLALAVFNGTTGVQVHRLDVNEIQQQMSNPLFPDPNHQYFVGKVLHIKCENMSVRLNACGTFSISYTQRSGELIPSLWESRNELSSVILRYIGNQIDKGVLAVKAAPREKRSVPSCLKHLPLLDGRKYKTYTSKQVQSLYTTRFGKFSPPMGMIWKRKSKKLYLFLRMVGLVGEENIGDYCTIKPTT